MSKLILYVLVVPLVVWGCDSVNINVIFKKNRYYQARVFYMALIFSVSYFYWYYWWLCYNIYGIWKRD